MSIELQLDDIQYHVNRLETLLEALQPQPMTMAAAIALSRVASAKTTIDDGTICAIIATTKGYNWIEIRNGDVARTGIDQTLEQVEEWINRLPGYVRAEHRVWLPI
jgi:hypothetical protein